MRCAEYKNKHDNIHDREALQIRETNIKTRMTTFIKTKFNKSDDQTNIDNIVE